MSNAAQNSSKFCHIIRGVRFPVLQGFTEQHFQEALDFVPGDGDLIIRSFPKTGSTWLQYIVLQIRSKGQSFPSYNDLFLKVSPTITTAGTASLNTHGKHKFYKHHIPYDKVQENSKSKYIYSYRHPEDTVVSYHNYWNNTNPEIALELNEFFELFVNGNVWYGNYFEHILPFYERRADENLLMVSYEKLHANRKEQVLRIAHFLGEEYHKELLDDSQLLDKILKHTSFDYMKEKLSVPRPDTTDKNQGRMSKNLANEWGFFRKGIVGDGKVSLTETQRQRLREAAEKVLKDTSIIKEWYPDISN